MIKEPVRENDFSLILVPARAGNTTAVSISDEKLRGQRKS
jgi:hypothetical protein